MDRKPMLSHVLELVTNGDDSVQVKLPANTQWIWKADSDLTQHLRTPMLDE